MYKLYNGDCLELMKDLAPGSVDMVLCDLPYGTTACKWDAVLPFPELWAHYTRVLKPKGVSAFTASQPFTSTLVLSNPKWFRCEWIWEKNRGSNFATTKYFPMKEHESVLVFGAGPGTFNPIYEERAEGGKGRAAYKINPSNTGKRETTGGMTDKEVREIDPNKRVPRSIQKFNTQVGLHPTQKPVALMEYLIRTYTNEGDTVLDNCMGSGTTGVACANTGRKFIGMEKDTEHGYYAIAMRRISEAYAKVVTPAQVATPITPEPATQSAWTHDGDTYALALSDTNVCRIARKDVNAWELTATLNGQKYRGERTELAEMLKVADGLIAKTQTEVNQCTS